MINALLSALWFFAPAAYANMMPLYASKISWLKKYDYPLDFNKTFRGKRIFGSHKTWRGLIFAFITTVPLIWLQQYLYNHSDFFRDISYIDYESINVVWLSFLFTLGALGGDAIRSFFKRQSGIQSGGTWFPFDQIDYVIGGLIATSFVVHLTLAQYILVAVTYFLIHPIATSLGYLLKIRERPI
jgi:CDP-2,3-bis-(O-geranylgeranyl)-sn-glycerol synthase